MNVLDQVVLAVIGMAQATNPFAVITRGALPADNGICMELGASRIERYMDKSAAISLTISLNGKNTDMQLLSEALQNIHATLTQTKNYPRTDEYQITNIETVSMPAFLDREENKQLLFGSSLEVKFYYPKEVFSLWQLMA